MSGESIAVGLWRREYLPWAQIPIECVLLGSPEDERSNDDYFDVLPWVKDTIMYAYEYHCYALCILRVSLVHVKTQQSSHRESDDSVADTYRSICEPLGKTRDKPTNRGCPVQFLTVGPAVVVTRSMCDSSDCARPPGQPLPHIETHSDWDNLARHISVSVLFRGWESRS